MFSAALFAIAKTRKQPCPLAEEWIKMVYIHIMEHYSVRKKNEIMPFTETWMNLKDYYTKQSKSDRER